MVSGIPDSFRVVVVCRARHSGQRALVLEAIGRDIITIPREPRASPGRFSKTRSMSCSSPPHSIAPCGQTSSPIPPSSVAESRADRQPAEVAALLRAGHHSGFRHDCHGSDSRVPGGWNRFRRVRSPRWCGRSTNEECAARQLPGGSRSFGQALPRPMPYRSPLGGAVLLLDRHSLVQQRPRLARGFAFLIAVRRSNGLVRAPTRGWLLRHGPELSRALFGSP